MTYKHMIGLQCDFHPLPPTQITSIMLNHFKFFKKFSPTLSSEILLHKYSFSTSACIEFFFCNKWELCNQMLVPQLYFTHGEYSKCVTSPHIQPLSVDVIHNSYDMLACALSSSALHGLSLQKHVKLYTHDSDEKQDDDDVIFII